MNREPSRTMGILLLFTSLTLFGAKALAVTFNVSNADEFQAALTTAGSNGGDDEIVLTPGTYGGNFKYTAGESAAPTYERAVPVKKERYWTENSEPTSSK